MPVVMNTTDQMVDIPVRDIISSTDTQARVMLRDATIRGYAELIADGTAFPAIVVFTDGSSYWLADGFHRLAAHKQAGKDSITAIVKLGSKRDATRYACRANGKHGLPMSIADKRRAVELMLNDLDVAEALRDPDDDTWTQRKVAQHCGVSHTFVSNLLRERDQRGGNVAAPPRPVEQQAAPSKFVDTVLDHADAPYQPQMPQAPHVTTYQGYQPTRSPGYQPTRSPASPPPVQVQPAGSAQVHAQVHAPAEFAMMTVLITWSYADADGQTIEGELGMREIDQLPANVRAALLWALGVR